MKILISGGHITPALAVIDELLAQGERDITVVGKKYDTGRALSMEAQLVARRGVPFYHLQAGRMTRVASMSSLKHLAYTPLGMMKSVRLVRSIRPDVCLSFGGYIAFSLGIAAKLNGIRVITHEQTLIPGVTSRLISKVAKKTLISYPQTAYFFPKKNTHLTGNPVRKSIFKKGETALLSKRDPAVPLILVMGGSLGSVSLNEHVVKIIQELTQDFFVVHQTGKSTTAGGYTSLSKNVRDRYIRVPHILEDDLGPLYDRASLVITRSGANTVSELMATHIPAVLVPLPWSAGGEQMAQARLLASVGAGVIFDQAETSKELLELTGGVFKNRTLHRKAYEKLSSYYYPNAASSIVSFIRPS